ncbi:hypothetical protein BK664_24575 [Pseudomonas brassicacearum]|uniref:Uncharacterized protein n=1 Tax=Pseudomonas brassicacearum TaxID=930166 RepID=A0A423J7J0_9PSED|nr:hypothetical protein BK664_24575 [Pseudomonas brassicacearum]
MSWLFSQALVAEYSAATSSGGAPYAPLSVMPTPHKFWRNDKTMEPSQLSRFGLTCAVLTEDHGAALLTWFLADSRVRTYPLLGMVPASMAPGLDCGVKWRESSAKYDLERSTWKTHHCLWEEDLPWSSVTLPKWGMTRSGALFQHPTLERPISANAFGLLPTPMAGDSRRGDCPSERQRRSPSLVSAHRNWPTPVASMSKGSSPAALTRKSGADRSNDRLDHAVMASDGGQLNPEWVEWLMGWPIGWTELKPLAMDRFHEWQRQHTTCSPVPNEEDK